MPTVYQKLAEHPDSKTVPIGKFEFNREQALNYEKLVAQGARFDHVVYRWVQSDEGRGCYSDGRYRNDHGRDPPPRLMFVAYSDDGTYEWYKYEGPCIGSGRNTIKIGDEPRVTLAKFFRGEVEKPAKRRVVKKKARSPLPPLSTPSSSSSLSTPPHRRKERQPVKKPVKKRVVKKERRHQPVKKAAIALTIAAKLAEHPDSKTVPIGKFEFNREQALNYEKLVAQGARFDHVVYRWVQSDEGRGCYSDGRYRNDHGRDPPPRLMFVAYSDDGTYEWYKYEGPCIGSGRNTIKIGDEPRVTLAKFFRGEA